MAVESPAKLPCPSAEELRRLLRGKLPEENQENLTGHLDDCTNCQSKLELLADGDTNLSGTIKHIDQAEPAKASAYWKAIDAVGGNLTATFAALDTKPSAKGNLEFLRPLKLPGKIGRLGHFQVIREIGRGGMGIVLQAFDPTLERDVALKVLDPQLAHNETARQRFVREARAAAAVTHDNIVTVYSVNEDEASGLPFFAMQLITGNTLEQRIQKEGKLGVEALVSIAYQASQGLAAAHAGGLIHRDIKPGNILLEAGTDKALLTDFGLARAAEDLKLTRTGFVAGTPLYMAPEQARGEEVDARADLFSLGSVMYEALAGKPPFDGTTPLAVLRRVADEAHPRITRQNAEVPDWLEDIIDELLEKEPNRRIASAEELSKRLAANYPSIAACGVATPVDCTVARTASRFLGRRRKSALTTAAVLGLPFLLGIGVGTVLGWSIKPKETQAVAVAAPNMPGAPLPAPVEPPLTGPDPVRMLNVTNGAVMSVAVAEDGVTVVAGLEDGSFILWDQEKNRKLLTHAGAHDAPIHAVDISKDGKTVITAGDDGNLKVWDVTGAAKMLQTFTKHPTSVRSAAFDPSGQKIVTGDRDGMVRIWELGLNEPIQKFDHGGSITAVAFGPDNLSVASVIYNKTAMLWEIPTGRNRATLGKHDGPLYGIAFSPDGAWVALAGWDKSISLWDANSGNFIRRITNAHSDGVMTIAFSGCNRVLASAGLDGAVKVWDAETGRMKAEFTRHKGMVHSVKFVPKCKLLLSGGRDGFVRVWEVQDKPRPPKCR